MSETGGNCVSCKFSFLFFPLFSKQSFSHYNNIIFFYFFTAGVLPFIKSLTLIKTNAEVWMQVICFILCLGLAGALAALKKDQVAQHAIKFYQSKATSYGQGWVAKNCKRLVGLLRQKNVVVKKLEAAAAAVGRDQGLSEPEKLFQVLDRE